MPAACQTLVSVCFVFKRHRYPVKLGAHLWVSPLFTQQILIARHPTGEMRGRTVKQTGGGEGSLQPFDRYCRRAQAIE